MGFGIFFFLALGFYLIGSGDDSGWSFVGFMLFLIWAIVKGMKPSYREQKAEWNFPTP